MNQTVDSVNKVYNLKSPESSYANANFPLGLEHNTYKKILTKMLQYVPFKQQNNGKILDFKNIYSY